MRQDGFETRSPACTMFIRTARFLVSTPWVRGTSAETAVGGSSRSAGYTHSYWIAATAYTRQGESEITITDSEALSYAASDGAQESVGQHTRGQARKQPQAIVHVGVDEKSFRKGHSYMTVVCDLDQSTVEYVAENRTSESLSGYYQSLLPEHLDAIEAVAMDMWDPYVHATVDCVPLAADKIVYDRFYIMKHMNDAVNKVRLEEHQALSSQGDDVLKGTKHWWLYTYDNMPDKYLRAFEAVRDQNLRTSRAWAIKETLRDLWNYRSMTWARKFFKNWFGWARRSRLSPVKNLAAMLKRRLDNILNYCNHQITNAVAEGLNSKIMAIKRLAGGYRNKENFKTVIYFFCGGLDLYPR